MSRILVGILALALCIGVVSCVDLGTTTTDLSLTTSSTVSPDAVQSAEQTVKATADMRPGGIPNHFTQGDTGEFAREAGDFDPNSYFGVLPNLSMEPGYVLDYLYIFDGMGGYPVIYARPSEQPPYTSSAQLDAVFGDSLDFYSEYIRIEDTREGYFEFATFKIMAAQFYLWWHAGYNDATIVCDKESLERTLSAADATFEGDMIPDSLRRKAGKLDLTPTVEFPDATTAVVRLVTFSMWGGFEELRMTISRETPHEVLGTRVETLIEYDCGVSF